MSTPNRRKQRLRIIDDQASDYSDDEDMARNLDSVTTRMRDMRCSSPSPSRQQIRQGQQALLSTTTMPGNTNVAMQVPNFPGIAVPGGMGVSLNALSADWKGAWLSVVNQFCYTTFNNLKKLEGMLSATILQEHGRSALPTLGPIKNPQHPTKCVDEMIDRIVEILHHSAAKTPGLKSKLRPIPQSSGVIERLSKLQELIDIYVTSTAAKEQKIK